MKPQPLNITVLFYILVVSLTANSGVNNSATKCLEIFERELIKINSDDGTFYPRNLPTSQVDFYSTKSFLAEKIRSQSFGKVQSVFSEKFDTRFYYAATAIPDKDGVIPMIDPESSVVYILLHGGGTARGGGGNWRDLINFIADIGESAISVDLPGHAEGSLSQKQVGVGTLTWLRDIINEVKKSNKKIVLIGHSYGSNIIEKYVRLYNGSAAVDGALLLSWIPTLPEMHHWQNVVMQRMKFNKDMIVNPYAGYTLDSFFRETENGKFEQRLKDPTKINPNMRVRSLVGANEEYFKGPIAGKSQAPIGPNTFDVIPYYEDKFENGVHTRKPNAGHAIFSHHDENGTRTVDNEALAIAGKDWKTEKESSIKYVSRGADTPAPPVKLAQLYKSDRTFKSWFQAKYGDKQNLIKNKDEKDVLENFRYNKPAQKIIDEYEYVHHVSVLKSKHAAHTQLRLSYEVTAHKYSTDLRFKDWADKKYGKGKILRWFSQKDEFMGQKVLNDYDAEYEKRLSEIYEEVKATQNTHPDFYSKHVAPKLKTLEIPKDVKMEDTLKWLYDNHPEFKEWAVKRYGERKILGIIHTGDASKNQPLVDEYKQILEKNNNLRDDALLNAYYLEIIRGSNDGSSYYPTTAAD